MTCFTERTLIKRWAMHLNVTTVSIACTTARIPIGLTFRFQEVVVMAMGKLGQVGDHGGVRVDLLCWCAAVVLYSTISFQMMVVEGSTLPNCSYPAVYAFGDSLSDTGNSIAAFPEQFANAELDPNGIQFPMHAADRYTDGKLLLDFLAFGVRRRPIYPVLRGTGGDFTFGTNFAAYGAPARTVKVWTKDNGFNSPFSLDVQHEWSERYKIRVWFYESPTFNPPGRLNQSLPKLATFNASLFTVWSGYQDYFFSLYDKTLTVAKTQKIVPDVVQAIEDHIVKMLTPVVYIPPATPSLIMPIAQTIMVVNLPPLGCIPAMLTLYGGSKAKYDSYGCLSDLNNITSTHNKLLEKKVIALRAKYPAAKILYADAEGVYTDILKNPKSYNVTAPLKACCGVGGSYNFNKGVTCGQSGMFEGKFVNLTTSLPAMPCADPVAHLSWDGIHTSNTFNKAAATAFLLGKHITPTGGLNCSPDFTFWEARS